MKRPTIIRKSIRTLAAIMCIACAGAGAGAAAGCSPKTNDGAGPEHSLAATREEIDSAMKTAGINEPLIGCWIPPRSHQMKTPEDADARMAEVKASGLNCVSTHQSDLYNKNFMTRLLDAAEKNGVKVIIELGGDLSGNSIKQNLRRVEETKDHPAVIGYNLFDEPAASMQPALASEFGKIREITGDSKLLLINMLPNYGQREVMAPEVTEGLTWYRTYLDNFLKTGTDVLSFDFYPYHENKAGDQANLLRMMENLSDMTVMSKKYNVPAWGFLQNSSWPGMRAPESNELLLISHLHLIFGFESYSYFLYADTENEAEGSFTGMLRWDNTLSDIYYRVRDNNVHLAGTRYRFLSYSLKGFLTGKLALPGFADAIDGSLKLASDDNLKSFDADRDTLIGIFEPRTAEENKAKGYADDTAEKGYYVLNYDFENESSVKLDFAQSTPYTVWTSAGIAAMGEGESVELTIPPCDAVFVELRTFGDYQAR